MPKGQTRDIVRVRNYLLRPDVDIWNETLWNAFHIDEEELFNGNAKELNQAFLWGAKLYINKPAAFKHFDDGFVAACGWSIGTLAERVVENWEEEEEAHA